MNPAFKMEGLQDTLEVFEDRVTIAPKGVMGFINKGLKGKKEILFVSITAVQLKESGMLSGYLQFTIPGGNESRGGILDAVKDENTFFFKGKEANNQALKIKRYITDAIHQSRTPKANVTTSNLSDELVKLAQLREQGILSEEEFKAAKSKLL